MCYAERCCFFMKLETGCVLLGIGSLIFALLMTAASASIFFLHYSNADDFNVQLSAHTTLDAYFSRSCIRIILCVIICMGALLILSSVLLLLGISKRKPGFLLFYFGYGLFFTILCNIGALLLLLGKFWLSSVTIFSASLFYVHFLIVIHTVYEGMQRGKVYGFTSHQKLDDDIAILDGSVNETED